MAIAACNAIPEIAVAFDFSRPDMHYVNTFRVKTSDGFTSRGTNLYQPETKNDIFEYHPDDTIYPCRREDLKGTDSHDYEKKFTKLWKQLNNEWKISNLIQKLVLKKKINYLMISKIMKERANGIYDLFSRDCDLDLLELKLLMRKV